MTKMPVQPLLPTCQVCDLLHLRAKQTPDRVFAMFVPGDQWSYAQTLDEVRRSAAGMQQLGVQPGELVLVWLGNGPDALRTMLAINYLGAVAVPINTAYRGALLEHVLSNTAASLMICDGRLLDRLAGAQLARLRRVVVMGPERMDIAGVELLGGELLLADSEPEPISCEVQPWDNAVVIYTSGTTGPSKGVLSSYLHLWTTATAFRHLDDSDRSLVSLPLYHIGGVLGYYCALLTGGSLVLVESFSVSRFWQVVREYGVTSTGLLGVMLPFLLKQSPFQGDREHSLRSVLVAPLDEGASAFAERFGVDIYTEYNMTELCMPLFSEANPGVLGTCGRLREGVELRIVDEHDFEVPVGAVGELIVRSEHPWALSHGYLNNLEATARAWRNGWFHTGDAFRCDADGNYFFVDRLKDALRRRGENISSFEVEAAILAHPAVREVAVVGVPSEVAEDEVMAVLALAPNQELSPEQLIEFLKPRLADFMIPRYLRFMQELPKTPTHKVLKHELRGQGVTADSWDREGSEIVVRRQRLEVRS
ncbi:AMP-binding protein [Metapseudomonas resinovorans]|uniref:AMP-binding protein n=1 Tax=Metapseudomonas resinovorans TaxID=53412 RepID=UPI0012DEA2BE|nr:AMP-binding protein [Pseudomonas resinovorans]